MSEQHVMIDKVTTTMALVGLASGKHHLAGGVYERIVRAWIDSRRDGRRVESVTVHLTEEELLMLRTHVPWWA